MADNDKDIKQYGLSDEDYAAYQKQVDENMEKRRVIREKRKNSINLPSKPILILLAILIVIGAVIFSFTDFFMIDNIQVKGNSYFTAEEIISMSHASVGGNIIYSPGSSSIKSYLKENPYIKNVRVKRQLPSTLIIEVEERKQIAALIYDKEYLIIDEEGVLLRKSQETPELTLVSGITIKKIKIGEEIGTKQETLMTQALEILKAMKANDLYFTRLEMSDSYINACILDNLICKGQYDQLMLAIEKGRLHKILDNLISKGVKRGTITLSEEGYASYMPTLE